METPSVKRRGKRGGPKKHRTWITIEEPTIAALRAQGEKLGYSVSALAQLVLDRGVRAGLIDDDTPSPHGAEMVRVTQDEHREHLKAQISQLHKQARRTLAGQTRPQGAADRPDAAECLT